ncbi:hypothetical protein HNR77_005841 [Paenibacillus sp. JGP012]|nr:hypothetical protein [Paenibacillus sp. JGP012]
MRSFNSRTMERRCSKARYNATGTLIILETHLGKCNREYTKAARSSSEDGLLDGFNDFGLFVDYRRTGYDIINAPLEALHTC